MPFSVNQQEYLKKATRRWNFKTGATRSGKTWLDYTAVIPKRIMSCTGDGLITIVGNNKNSVERNVLTPMRNIWSPRLVGNIKQNDNSVVLFGKSCVVVGADKVNQVPKIQGAGIEYCYGDEVATWHPEFFEMLKSRLDKPNSCFDGTNNPDHPNHWLKQFLDSGADIYHQHYHIDDNPYLSKEFVENLKKEYAGTVYYDRFIEGKWTLASGLIYQDYKQAVVTTKPRQYEEYQIAVDYGTHNPTVFLLFGKSENIWYLIREYYHSGRETRNPLTDQEYHDALIEFIAGLPIRRIIVDPSASSFITLIRRNGGYSVRNADNAVLDGIRNTARAMNSGAVKINDCCQRTIEEFGTYSWDDKKDEDRPIQENDHAMDALRYFVRMNRRELLRDYRWSA